MRRCMNQEVKAAVARVRSRVCHDQKSDYQFLRYRLNGRISCRLIPEILAKSGASCMQLHYDEPKKVGVKCRG